MKTAPDRSYSRGSRLAAFSLAGAMLFDVLPLPATVQARYGATSRAARRGRKVHLRYRLVARQPTAGRIHANAGPLPSLAPAPSRRPAAPARRSTDAVTAPARRSPDAAAAPARWSPGAAAAAARWTAAAGAARSSWAPATGAAPSRWTAENEAAGRPRGASIGVLASARIAPKGAAAPHSAGSSQLASIRTAQAGEDDRAAAPRVTEPAGRDLSLTAGESRVLTFRGLLRVVIGDPAVADVAAVSTSDLVVTAKGRGQTTLFVWDSAGRHEYTVTVAPPATPDLAPVAERLAALINDPGLTVRSVGDTLFLEGTADTPEAAQRAELLAKAVAANVKNLIQVRAAAPQESAVEKSAQALNEALQGTGVTARALSDGSVLVEGTVTPDAAERARRVIESVGKTMTVIDALTIEAVALPQVQIRARVVDINKTRLKNLGINWGSISSKRDAEGTITYTFVEQPILFGIIPHDKANNLLPFGGQLQALVQNNAARILSEPNMVVMEGTEGHILIGGEFPVPVVQSQVGGVGSITVQFKEFGIRLAVQPLRVAGDEITMKVAPEVSLLDFANAVQVSGFTLPALRTRREETTVRIRGGQTFAIGGLIQNDYSRSIRRVPLVSQIPVLGELFKSKSWQKDETELVILITAEVVPTGTSPAVNAIDREAPNMPIPRPGVPESIRPRPVEPGAAPAPGTDTPRPSH